MKQQQRDRNRPESGLAAQRISEVFGAARLPFHLTQLRNLSTARSRMRCTDSEDRCLSRLRAARKTVAASLSSRHRSSLLEASLRAQPQHRRKSRRSDNVWNGLSMLPGPRESRPSSRLYSLGRGSQRARRRSNSWLARERRERAAWQCRGICSKYAIQHVYIQTDYYIMYALTLIVIKHMTI